MARVNIKTTFKGIIKSRVRSWSRTVALGCD
jgi:hypothetical protein